MARNFACLLICHVLPQDAVILKLDKAKNDPVSAPGSREGEDSFSLQPVQELWIYVQSRLIIAHIGEIGGSRVDGKDANRNHL